MHLSGVHHVDAEQRQVKIEMAPDGTQRAAAAPDDHEVLVLHQQVTCSAMPSMVSSSTHARPALAPA